MKRVDYHLERYHDAIPTGTADAPPALATETDRWRLSLCAIGVKMEYMLLVARAYRLGVDSHWASCLGVALRELRPLFPPADDAGFRAWDPTPLLRELRRAEPPRRSGGAVSAASTACGLADAGRIAAARAALKGGEPLPRPSPSPELQAALERLHPKPDRHTPAVTEAEFAAAADALERATHSLPAARRITTASLHHSALRMRGATAPGPDGWSGDMVRRAACLHKRAMACLLERYMHALRDTRDPLLANVLMDAVMLAFLKPGSSGAPTSDGDAEARPAPSRYRPISIAGAFARCILAKAVTLSRKRLRDALDPLGQFALTGTLRPVARLMAATASCSRKGVPYVLTRADITNAFGSAGQGALLQAIRRIGAVAPELAAMSLRAQCSTRGDGDVELVLRGDYELDDERLAVRRWARGGAQGPPDMPAAFAMVMAMVDEEAAARAGDDREMPASVEAASDELWALFRQVADLPDTPAAGWTDALRELWSGPRSDACVTTLYADDAHSAGYYFTAIRRTLWRVVCGRARGLVEAPHKCGLLTAPRWRAALDTLISPLRCGDPAAWPLMESMKVLGVTFSDLGDDGSMHAAIADSLATSVVGPIQRLTREVHDGARKGTALFLLHRYVLPVLAYHQGAWGLLAASAAWRDVDDALDAFCTAVCPTDLRDRLLRGSMLRRELTLPRGVGGLGIPRAAAEAPYRAAELWTREEAVAAGARAELVARAYRWAPARPLRRAGWAHVTMEAYHEANTRSPLTKAASGRDKRRLEQNAMRGGTRAFMSVPWRSELSIDDDAFDVAWRLVFGGITDAMTARIDHPQHGHRWRGERMEWAFAEALHDGLPPGSVVTGEKPAPERQPVGEAVPDPGDRADVDVLTKTGKRFVYDVRTVNVQCASGARSSAQAQCAAIEAEKRRHYSKYYRFFAPFVITLSGAVSQASAEALTPVTKTVARGDRTSLDWEPARWVENILHRMAVEMVKTMAIIATRVVLPPVQHRVARDVH